MFKGNNSFVILNMILELDTSIVGHKGKGWIY